MKNLFTILFLLCTTVQFTEAANYYVSAKLGASNGTGSEADPFKTIQSAINLMQAGDTCFIMEGRYHEEIVASDLEGTVDAPYVFTKYQDQKVVLDGTSIISSLWTLHEDNIYKTTLTEDIWQLFVDEKMMTSARWPNAEAWSMDMWDKANTWGHQEENSSDGNFIDDGQRDLAGTGIDFTGAVAVMNTGSWLSFARKVNSHGAGSNTFTYDEIGNGYHHKIENGSYFFEASYACLDVENEWYYDASTKELFFIPANGMNPNELSIYGKTNTYAFDIENSSYLKFSGLYFFATTVKFTNSNHFTLENCDFNYPSYSKRMLGEIETAAPTAIDAGSNNNSYNVVKNCRFEKADGTGLFMTGKYDRIENCYFHDIDYSCVGGLNDNVLNIRDANFLKLQYTTIDWGGNSLGIKVGKSSEVAFCEVSNIGFLQHDGAAIQASEYDVDGINLHHNWVHDCIKFALRFDSPWNNGDSYGTNGIMAYNVFWNAKPIIPKGDHHFVYNNTGFSNEGFDIGIYSDESHGGFNYSTETRNNLVFAISGSNSKTITEYNGIDENNWIGNDLSPKLAVSSQLNDPENLDFRPRIDSDLIDAGYYKERITNTFNGVSPDIGAYEYNPTSYWVPGFRFTKTSNPIPLDQGIATSDHIKLMWREAYDASSYDLYISKDSLVTVEATTTDPTFIGNTFTNKISPGQLIEGQKYYWRADAKKGDKTTIGDVWSFTAGVGANSSEGNYQNIRWTGSTDSDWFTASNWEMGTVPGATDHVIISPSSNDPIINTHIIVNHLTLEDHVNLTVNKGSSLTIARDLTANLGYIIVASGGELMTQGKVTGNHHQFIHEGEVDEVHLIGSPINNKLGHEINTDIFFYDETIKYNSSVDHSSSGNDGADRWTALGSNEIMQPGLGYSTTLSTTNTFQGTPNSGNISVDMSSTDHDETGTNYEQYFEGINLVANPYPTTLSLHSFLSSNRASIEPVIWLWNEEIQDYMTISPLGQVGENDTNAPLRNGKIPPFQGFFVKANPTISPLNFTPEMQMIDSTSNQSSFGDETKHFQTIRLSLNSSSNQDLNNETLIGFVEDASPDEDKYDAQKLIINEGMKLFSYANERALAIQGLPMIESEDTVSLGITIEESTQYSIEIAALNNWPSEMPIILKDKILDVHHDLTIDDAYIFESEAIVNQNRFELSFVESEILTNSTGNSLLGIQVRYQKNGIQLEVNPTSDQLLSLEILDTAGKALFKKQYQVNTANAFAPYNFHANQVYIIRMVSKKGVLIERFMF